MAIIDSIISHQIWLQRNASGQVKELAPFIEKMRVEIRKQVLAFGDDSRTRANLQKMLTELETKLKAISSDWESALLEYVQELGAYEAEWTAKTLGENASANFKVPAAAQVYAAIKFNPLNLSNKPADLTALTAGWGETEVSRLITGVKTGFVYGNTTRQIVKEVVGAGGFADISERNAATVIRTVLNHVSNQARELTYERNKDIITGYQWISTLDSRTSTICKGYDHQKYEIGKGPLPPAHPNCLLGDTVVSTCSTVSNVFKRTYKGVIVYITTKSGRRLSITPNHEVLTTSGWVAAGALNKGSQLICSDNSTVSVHHKENNVVAEFSDVFSAANIAVNASAVRTSPTTTEDFHGDGTDGEVKIILVDGFSWDKVKASLAENIVGDKFPTTAGVNVPFVGFRSAEKLTMVGFTPSDGCVRSCAKRATLLGGGFSHSRPHSSASSSNFDSLSVKQSYDWVARSADDFADFDWTQAAGVEIDDVVDLVFSEADFCGHVYNLENENNWYLANGIVAHNCRSTTIPQVDSDLDFLDEGATRASKGANGGEPISADISYYEFLKRQPAFFQDEALGPVRGKIFRNSGISPEEFRTISTDGFGRPLTLNEMAALDERVAEYLRNI